MLEKIIYLVVMALGSGLLARSLAGRIQVLRAANSVDHRGNVLKRLKGVWLHVILQARMINGDVLAGLMHAFIFWGFLAVMLNTLQFFISGFAPGSEFSFPGLHHAQPLGTAYRWVRDLFEVLVLLGVGVALVRRLVIKPKRLHYSFEAILILLFIAALMVTDFLLSGAGAVMHNLTAPLSPAENIVGGLLAAKGPAGAVFVYKLNWWIHLAVLLVFINLLPLGKHFHVLTSFIKVYLRNLDPPGKLPTIDFEDEELEDYGVSRLTQQSWSNWLDGYSCTECGRCDYFCPATQTGKELSPRHIITASRDQVYAHQPDLIKRLALAQNGGAGVVFEDGFATLVGEVHTDQALWACTTCGACDTHCPLFIEHVNPIVEMRRHLVMEQEGRFPKELATTFKGLENQGNPWGIGAQNRLAWAAGLDVKTLDEKPDAEYIYFVGCLASFDENSKVTARALVELLNHAEVSFAVLQQESCCGDPARRAGHEYLAQSLIEINADQFKVAQPKKVFTACPHCFNTLKHEYSDFGVEFGEVIHHSELLLKLIHEGKLQVAGKAIGKFVFHDSCYLGRYNNIYGQPRDILKAIPGAELTEAKFSHDKGFCCGAGGGRMFMEETEGERVNHFRYKQLAETGAEKIAVACPFCLTMLGDASAELGDEGGIETTDIAVLLRDALVG